MPPRPIRHSGLQKQVLSLYRECLRKAIQLNKGSSSSSSPTSSSSSSSSSLSSSSSSSSRSTDPGTVISSSSSPSSTSVSYPSSTWQTKDGIQYIRQEFRTKATTIDKLDIQRIEFLLRQGKKKLELLQMNGIQNITSINVP